MTEPIEPRPIGDEYETVLDEKMRLATQDWRYASGELYRQRAIKRKPVVTVLPVRPAVNGGHDVLLVKQYRPAIRQWSWEAVAGGIDPEDYGPGNLEAHGALDLATARRAAERELLEETGLHVADLRFLTSAWVSPGWTDEHNTLFLALGITATGRERAGWDADNVKHQWMSFEEAFRRTHDLKTLAVLTLARQRIATNDQVSLSIVLRELKRVLDTRPDIGAITVSQQPSGDLATQQLAEHFDNERGQEFWQQQGLPVVDPDHARIAACQVPEEMIRENPVSATAVACEAAWKAQSERVREEWDSMRQPESGTPSDGGGPSDA